MSLTPELSLTLLGFGMVASFMALIMTRRLTPLVALIVIPVLFGLLAGDAAGLGQMMIEGVTKLAPTGVMLMFAILYFGLMTDAGLFDPAVRRLVRLVHADPVKISIGTVLLAALVSLDGDGSTTYVITTAALLPLYRCMGMSRLRLVCLLMLTSGVMNITPWGGPTARAASALGLDARDIFVPLIPAMIGGLIFLVGLAWIFGRAERRRLEGQVVDVSVEALVEVCVSQDVEARRENLFWFNLALTATLLVLLVVGILPLPILMMLAFAIALIVNYPRIEDQKARISAHAGNVLAVVSLIFAAGIFTGILGGAGMVEAMSRSVVAVIPPQLGPYMAPITAALSLPFTFFISNDAFYFGVLPILAETAGHYGIAPVEIARASLMGQPFHLLSPLVPSTYLLVTLAGVELADHQRFTLKWAVAVGLVMSAVAMATLVFPFAKL
jgi:citrate-Mg2+:H+ or citrate-Ca2+:H+ symporter, CitMHS family